MFKTTYQLSIYRIALLALALVLTGLAMVPSATATVCTPGQTRTIVYPNCCEDSDPPPAPPRTSRTAQNQVCSDYGTWVNVGFPYCVSAKFCML